MSINRGRECFSGKQNKLTTVIRLINDLLTEVFVGTYVRFSERDRYNWFY